MKSTRKNQQNNFRRWICPSQRFANNVANKIEITTSQKKFSLSRLSTSKAIQINYLKVINPVLWSHLKLWKTVYKRLHSTHLSRHIEECNWVITEKHKTRLEEKMFFNLGDASETLLRTRAIDPTGPVWRHRGDEGAWRIPGDALHIVLVIS